MSILEDLTRKFDPILLKVNQGNTYVPIEDFLDRLNSTKAEWSSRVTHTAFFQGPKLPDKEYNGKIVPGKDQYVCTKDIELTINLYTVKMGELNSYHQSCPQTRTGSGSGINFDPDTAAKTALAEATKKACNQFGIGAYLLGKDNPEREIHEAHHEYLKSGEISDLKVAVQKAARVDGFADGMSSEALSKFFNVKPADLQDAEKLDEILRSRF